MWMVVLLQNKFILMVKGHYILVTGASSGIGSSICRELSNSYNLVLLGKDNLKINNLIKSLNNSSNHVSFIADLQQSEELETSLEKFLIGNNIQIHGFVHCAGFMNMLPSKMFSISAIQKTFTINLFSAAIIVKILLQRKFNSDSLKNIIFISSNISNFGAKAFGLYSSSKSGLDGLMRSLAVELAPKVRVNSILPGAIHTQMTTEIFQNQETANRLLDAYPLGEGFSEDIAKMVFFLISENSRWITGQQITVDGGRTINISG
jgi:NAD(P)-dependent dehydrogenase (short-subunit alcohol dehydrogenase family)